VYCSTAYDNVEANWSGISDGYICASTNLCSWGIGLSNMPSYLQWQEKWCRRKVVTRRKMVATEKDDREEKITIKKWNFWLDFKTVFTPYEMSHYQKCLCSGGCILVQSNRCSPTAGTKATTAKVKATTAVLQGCLWRWEVLWIISNLTRSIRMSFKFKPSTSSPQRSFWDHFAFETELGSFLIVHIKVTQLRWQAKKLTTSGSSQFSQFHSLYRWCLSLRLKWWGENQSTF